MLIFKGQKMRRARQQRRLVQRRKKSWRIILKKPMKGRLLEGTGATQCEMPQRKAAQSSRRCCMWKLESPLASENAFEEVVGQFVERMGSAVRKEHSRVVKRY